MSGEIFILTVGIGALDAGESLGIIPADNEFLHDLGDALNSESAIDHGIFFLVLIGEASEAFLAQKLDGTDSPQSVDSFIGRSELKG